MNLTLVSLKRKISELVKRTFWDSQYKKCTKDLLRNDKANNKIEFKFLPENKILVLVPHADDELIGCYQLLSLYPGNIKLFYFGFTGTTKSIENKNKRLEEIKKLSEIMDIDIIVSECDHAGKLFSTIKAYCPEYIFVPSFIDWHNEHIDCNTILQEVLLNSKDKAKIVLYQISVPISDTHITHYIPMNYSEQNAKWELFKHIYYSQKHLPLYRFSLQERINGVLFHSYAAEVYMVLSLKKWDEYMRRRSQSINSGKLALLQNYINNLDKIREVSSEMYFSVFNQ
jgi:hypothetical protein